MMSVNSFKDPGLSRKHPRMSLATQIRAKRKEGKPARKLLTFVLLAVSPAQVSPVVQEIQSLASPGSS